MPNGTYYLHIQARDAAENVGAISTYSARVHFSVDDITIETHGSLQARSHNWSWRCTGCTYRFAFGGSRISESAQYGTTTNTLAADSPPATLGNYLYLQARRRDGTESPVVQAAAYPLRRLSVGNNFACMIEQDEDMRTSGARLFCWGENDRHQARGESSSVTTGWPSTVKRGSGIVRTALEVAAGYRHACVLFASGSGYVGCWGKNSNGQLGKGSTSNQGGFNTVYIQKNPQRYLDGVMTISAGGEHTCAVKTDGTIRCWGYNNEGQLGDNSTTSRSTAVTVSGISNAVQVSGGDRHTCAVLNTGGIKCWGKGNDGRLGRGNTTNSKTPVSVSNISNAIQVSAGQYHTCALLANHKIKCWGYGGDGQLGRGSTATSHTPVDVTGTYTAIQVDSGNRHNCALLHNSTIQCWGDNGARQIGNSGTNFDDRTRMTAVNLFSGTDPRAIALGSSNQSMLITGWGGLHGWGKLTGLGAGTQSAHPQPIYAGQDQNNRLIQARFVGGGNYNRVACKRIDGDSSSHWKCRRE